MTTRSYITGSGDPEKLRLIEESFAMLRDSPTLPDLRMLYKSSSDMLSEGFIWGDGWWIQNSFGFTMGAVPLLDPFWSRILQNSYDAFWERIGDGVRIGADNGVPTNSNYGYRAPDGSLGDCVRPGVGIVYRQGDGDVDSYDWFYEATAAGVLMEAAILLFDRRPEQLRAFRESFSTELRWRARGRGRQTAEGVSDGAVRHDRRRAETDRRALPHGRGHGDSPGI